MEENSRGNTAKLKKIIPVFAMGLFFISPVWSTSLNPIFSMVGQSTITVSWNSAILGSTLLNFDSVDASAADTDATAYLSGFGITLSSVTNGTHVNIMNNNNLYGGVAATPVSAPNMLAQWGSNSAVSFTMNLSTPVPVVSFFRPGINNSTYPQWSVEAFDANGNILDSVGDVLQGLNGPAVQYFLIGHGTPIAALRINTDDQNTGAFSGALTDDLLLGNGSYIAVLATDSTFSNIISSGSIGQPTTTYANLNPNTVYYFKVKISTEDDSSYTNPAISTETLGTIVNSTYTVSYIGNFSQSGGAVISSDNGQNELGFNILMDTATGNFYVSYVSDNSTAFDSSSLWSLIKYNSSGIEIATATLKGFESDSIALDASGNLYVTEKDANNRWLDKFNSNLVFVSSSSLPVLNISRLTSDGTFIYAICDHGPGGATTYKLNSNLSIVASQSYNGGGTLNLGDQITLDNAGNVYARVSADNGYAQATHLLKYDNNLAALLNDTDITSLVPSRYTDGNNLVFLNGNLFLAISDTTTARMMVKKFDSGLNYTGVTSTFTSYTAPFIDRVSMKAGPDANLYVTGTTSNNNGDFLALKYDVNLVLLASATFDGSSHGTDQASDLCVFDSSHVYVTGMSYNGSDFDARTLKLDLSGGGGNASTSLNPVFTLISSNTVSVAWTFNPSSTYNVQLATASNFATLLSSKTLSANATTYTALTPNTSYFFRVKIATEPLSSFIPNTISTTTLQPPALSTTTLHPFVSFVSSNSIYTNWDFIPASSYNVELATVSNFVPILAAGSLSNNATAFFNLTANTSYFFHVKIATEPLSSFIPNTISTKTLQVIIDTTPPTIAMISPVNGSTFSILQPVTIAGTANDNMALSQVAIAVKRLADNLFLNSSSTWTASPQWLSAAGLANWFYPIPSGAFNVSSAYVVVSSATDTSNNSATTLPLTFYIAETTSPVISAISISTFSSNSATFTWTTDEPATSQIEFGTTTVYGSLSFFNGTLTTSHNSSITGLTPNTLYHYRVKSKDGSNNLANSNDFTFTTSSAPDVTPPVIFAVTSSSITSTGANISWNTDELSDSQIEYGLTTAYGNFAPLDTTLVTAHNKFLGGLAASTLYHYRVRSHDAAGNLALSVDFTFSTTTGTVDTLPPQVLINNPTNGASMQPNSFTVLSGHADDPSGIGSVVVFLKNLDANLFFNGANFASATQINLVPTLSNATATGVDLTYTVQAAVYVNGNYLLSVKASDSVGNNAVKNASFTVVGAGAGAGDTTPPTLAITSFQNNDTKTSLDMTSIVGTANDNNNLDHVSLEIQNSLNQWWNGGAWQTTASLLNANGLANWSLSLPISMWTDGTYLVKAHAFDLAGNTTQVTDNVTISGTGTANVAPTVTITSVIAGQTYSPANLATFIGTTNGVSVQTRISDLNLNLNWDPVHAVWGTNTVWSNAAVVASTWSSANSPAYWPNGHFKIVAQATGSNNLIATVEADFYVSITTGNVDFTPPAAIALSAQPGATVGSVKLNWTSTGDDGMTGTAAFYAIKYGLAPIIAEADWTNALDVSFAPTNQTPPVPLVSGSAQTMAVQNLTPGVAYFWAIRATDHNSNRSVLSNSPLAVAFSGCVAGLGDGEGTAIVAPSSLPTSTDTPLTITYTVGAHGITDGGRINIRVPDGFIFPQTSSPTLSGYFSAVTSNGSAVTLTRSINGQLINLNVSGTLNTGDTITINFLAHSNSCTLQSGVAFNVLSQATSCGALTAIASQPTVGIVAGAAAWLGFDSTEKFAQVAQPTPLSVRSQDVCSDNVAVGANVNVQASVLVWNTATLTYVADTDAALSLASNFSNSFASGNVTLPSGQSSVNLFYRVNVNDTRDHRVRIQYLDLGTQLSTLQNSMKMDPAAAAQGISQVSIDKGQTGALTSVTFSPPTETVFINYQTAPNVASTVLIKQGSTLIQQLWSNTTPVRLSWSGDQISAAAGTAPSGTYNIVIQAAGQQDTSLSATLQSVGVSGTLKNSVGLAPLVNTTVNIYGTAARVTQTDNTGAFSFNGLANGAYTLHVEQSGYAPKDVPFTFSGSNLNLGNVLVDALSQLILNVTRDNTSSELWGSVNTIDPTTQQAIWTSVHFAYGLTTADSGLTTDKPTILLKSGVSYLVNLSMPGYTAAPLTKTWATGEAYTWNLALTAKKGITGSITLANTIPNPNGMQITISAVRGTDTAPSQFSSAFIPAGESQTSYSLPNLDAAAYKLTFNTPGLSPTSVNVTMANVDLVQNVMMSQGGSATFTLTFQGDTTGLDLKDGVSDGKFPVTMRYATDNANGAQTLSVNTNASNTSVVTTVTGLADGSYKIYFDAVDGFVLNGTSPQILTVTAGVGTLTSNFVQNSGTLTGALTLPTGTDMNNMNFYLTLNGAVQTTPTISGNQFTFNNLASGKYSLSILNTLTNASKSLDVFISNGQITNVVIDLSAAQTYSISGVVGTSAAPPHDSLSTISANSTALTFYTATGQVSVSALSVFAKLILPDGTVSPLPTTTNSVLDPAKLKYGAINTVTGAYEIDGLEKGKSYRVGLNTDFDADGKSDIPQNDIILSPIANQTGVNFMILDGGKIDVAIASPNSESGYALTLQLIDADRKISLQQQTISLQGNAASVEFANLQAGRYLVTITDNNSPVKYSVAPQFVSLETITTAKTIAMTLVGSGRVQVALANRFGTLITAANASQLLPAGTLVQLVSQTQNLVASLDSTDGKYKAAIQPGIDYTMTIAPPANIADSDADKAFLPIQKNVRIDNSGAVLDLGVVVLAAGVQVSGTIKNDAGAGIAHVPVFAYQSLSPNVAAIETFTNDQGIFTLKNLSGITRFYDLIVNPTGDINSLPNLTEARKTAVDLTKPDQIADLAMTLSAVSGAIKGKAVSSSGPLLAGYGDQAGQPGVSVIITARLTQRVFNLLSNPDGSFSVALPAGSYDIQLIAQNCQPKIFSNQSVSNATVDLGSIALSNTGVSLTGKIRNVDGSLPTTDQITNLIALDGLKNRYLAALSKVSNGTLDSVESYVFYGLSANTVYDIIALDQGSRAKILKKALTTSNIDSSFDLTYIITDPTLFANFTLKVPEKNEIDLRLGCNQTFRNKDTDADGNGIADDDELNKFVSIVTGKGTLAGNSFSADRYSVDYTYTLGDETGIDALTVAANFHTSDINPTTGDNFSVTGQFSHPFGILAQNTNPISKSEGGKLTLTNGAAVTIPNGALTSATDDDITVGFRQADDVTAVGNITTSANKNARAAATIARAKLFGASAYPVGMYKAIQALDSLPTINPFGSFYDIFLPAGVSHFFANGYQPTLTLKYDDNADPTQINIYYFNEAQNVYTLENNNTRVDTLNHLISVDISHFSVFTVIASSVPVIRSGGYNGELDVFNFPNPFDLNMKTITLQNPGSSGATQNIQGTMIKIDLPSTLSGSATIKIFDMAGELVRTLHTDDLTSLTQNYIEWDGTNDHGEKVASGVYIGRLEIGSQTKTFKMAVVK